jgi:hypothetical protein
MTAPDGETIYDFGQNLAGDGNDKFAIVQDVHQRRLYVGRRKGQ